MMPLSVPYIKYVHDDLIEGPQRRIPRQRLLRLSEDSRQHIQAETKNIPRKEKGS